MDRTIATELQRELALMRQRGYASLAANMGEEVRQVTGHDGKDYQISVLLVWDREEGGPHSDRGGAQAPPRCVADNSGDRQTIRKSVAEMLPTVVASRSAIMTAAWLPDPSGS
jgi:hypothetical protein